MSNRPELPVARRPARTLPITGLALLLLLVGCADQVGTGGAWTGELRSSLSGTAVAPGGPVVVEISGEVQAGETLEVALPANLSAGFAWKVEPAAGAALTPVGEVDFRQIEPGLGAPARQAIRVQAGESGLATLRLVYRRPWEPDGTASGLYRVNGAGTGLATLLAAVSLPEPGLARQAPLSGSSAVAQPAGETPELPSSYNWCDLGFCTVIKDQGGCGSCWAFGTVGVLESAIMIRDGLTVDLSEQYLLSCNTDGWDCYSGWWAHDYHQSKYSAPETMAGAVPESELPYMGWAECGGPYSHPYRIASWGILSPESGVAPVADIKQAIYDKGPVAAAICVSGAFQGYTGGIFATDESSACDGGVNHAVVLVGWDDADGTWVLRNSWGPWWGESGYMRIVWGTSNVGYSTNYVSYISTQPPDNWAYLPIVVTTGH